MGGTKTCSGAIAKQRTAEPQGAASLSLAVLESDGRKREVQIMEASCRLLIEVVRRARRRKAIDVR